MAATRSSKKPDEEEATTESVEKINRSFVVVQFEEERFYGTVLVNWLVVQGAGDGKNWKKAK